MIWSDPWIDVATTKGIYAPFCTLIEPPCPPLPPNLFLRCVDTPPSDWAEFIGTTWTSAELAERVAGAKILCLYSEKELVGTCVVRPTTIDNAPLWILETLVARGYGAILMRQTMRYLWQLSGPFVLGYTWELTPFQFFGAWMKGWLRSAREYHFGWKWVGQTKKQTRPALPITISTAKGSVIASDSGLRDGWGYIQSISGEPDWTEVAKKGGWNKLWTHSFSPPSGWTWSGEIVVIGLLNYCGTKSPHWITPEIAPDV